MSSRIQVAVQYVVVPAAISAALVMACERVPSNRGRAVEDRFIDIGGAKLHYLDWGGPGPLIVFVHGFTTSAYDFATIAPALSESYRVMAPTRRGHGASDPAPDSFDVDVNVDDLAKFIRAFSNMPAVVVGMSHGGLEIPRLARRYPEQVRALIFLDGVYDWHGLASYPPISGFETDSLFDSFEELDRVHAEQFPEFWGESFRRRVHSQVVTRPDGRLAWQLSPAGPAFSRYIELWSDWDATDYQAIRVPVLAFRAHQAGFWENNLLARGFQATALEEARIAAAIDDSVKGRGFALLLAAVPDAEVVELDATHHLLHWQRPAELAAAMLEFLDRRLGSQ